MAYEPVTIREAAQLEVLLFVGLAFVGLLVAMALSVLVVAKLVRGYRRNGTRPMLYLGAGLGLLVTAPWVLRLVLSNLVAVSPAARSLAVRSSLVFELVVLFRVVTEDVPVDEFRHSLVAVGPIDGERHDDDRTPEESEGERVGKNAVADAHEREDTTDDRP